MEMDKDLLARQEARSLAKKAESAQKIIARMSQEKLDAIVKAVAEAFAAEAKDLADKINAGSLPFALTVDDSKLQIISPSLGSDALRVMLIAGAIAFGIVCLIMIILYRVNGVVAAIALLGQLAGTVACISGYFPNVSSFTLTIPGIAGIILSIGVGVDCNVIASERIRDEFKKQNVDAIFIINWPTQQITPPVTKAFAICSGRFVFGEICSTYS